MSGAPVSVVIPFYRGGDTIQRALDSLERQTVQPAEIVVVDDGSPAPFEEIPTHSRIPLRVVRLNRNQGIPAARNAGIRAGEEPWIAFLDQDDEWAADKLERQWRAVEAERKRGRARDDLVVFGRLLMETEDGPAHVRPPHRVSRAVERGGRHAVLAFLRYGNVVPLVTLLVGREVFDRYGYLDETLRGGADDTEFVLRLVGEGVTFRFDGDDERRPWSVAHRHTGENYSGDAARWVADQLVFIPRLADRYPAIAPLRNAFLARSHFTLGRRHEEHGERARAAAQYDTASRYDPLWWRPRVARLRLQSPPAVRRVTERLWTAAKGLLRESPGAGQG